MQDWKEILTTILWRDLESCTIEWTWSPDTHVEYVEEPDTSPADPVSLPFPSYTLIILSIESSCSIFWKG